MSHLLWVLSYLWSFVFCWSLVNLNFLLLSSFSVFLLCFLLYFTFMSWSFLVLLIEDRNWFLTLLLRRRILERYILVGILGCLNDLCNTFTVHLAFGLLCMMFAGTRYFCFYIKAFWKLRRHLSFIMRFSLIKILYVSWISGHFFISAYIKLLNTCIQICS